MTQPIASVIWLNYNSSKILNVVLKSLESIASFDVSFELIVIDNNSTDGSFYKVKDFLRKLDLNLKIIRLNINLRFTSGNNIGYLYSNRNSKYIVMINNDLIPESNSLGRIIEFMDKNPFIGAAQGIIYDISGNAIDNVGFLCSEILTNYAVKVVPERPIYVTYPSGAYVVIRREVIEKLGMLFN